MFFQLWHSSGGISVEAYTRQMIGGGLMYHDRLRLRVQCLDFEADMAEGSLQMHWQTHHNVVRGVQVGAHTHPIHTLRRSTTTGFTSWRFFTWFGARWRGVGDGQWSIPTSGYIFNHHMGDTLVIPEDGNQPHTQCPKCNIFCHSRTSMAATPPLSSEGG